jgi:protein TonB
MAGKINIFNPDWVDMIFEGKNQDYGAYVLRKGSSKRHLKALIIASCLFLTIIFGPILIKTIIPERKEQDLTVRMLSNINLDKPTEADNIVKEVAPPPPAVRNTIRFTPPVIAPDEEVSDQAEEPKMQNEVLDSKAAVGTVDFDKGTDDVEAPVATETNIVTEEEEAPFVIVEQMPEFPGGEKALLSYLSKSIKYPAIARENGIQGTVYVRFVIGKSGKVSKAEIVRGVDASLDEEAIRVINTMPNWSPGRQGGKEVPVSYTIPIRFELQ